MLKSSLVSVKEFLANRPEGGAIISLLILLIFFSLGTERFATGKNFLSMLTLGAEWGILAMGVTLLMISGEFDLSVGSMLGFGGLAAAAMVDAGVPTPISVVIILIVCIAFGLLQGIGVVKLGLPSFIITLGGLLVLQALSYIVFFNIGGGRFLSVPRGDAFYQIFNYRFESGFRVTALWFLGVAVIFFLILHWTRFGNWIFATGGNKLAAIQAGVPVNRVKIILFGLTAGLAGLAGIIQMTRFSTIGPARGVSLEMYLIAMVVMGGTRLSGGYGSVMGTLFGVFMMASIKNGLVYMKVSGYWLDAVVGIAILIAVIINTHSQRRVLGVSHE
jgi:simple sugar transport system permease protein|tara:strand:+ start:2483 stop:3478 length:996 start_codon:yes stop_codon:yes gene_type:complete